MNRVDTMTDVSEITEIADAERPSQWAGPLVSILVPTYNQNLEHLRECVESCLAQTYPHIEVVVSDNHSTNGASDYLRAIGNPLVRVVSPDQFCSMNENFAFCASSAKGEFISFLSSDDVLVPTAIELLVDVLREFPQAVFAAGNLYYTRDMPPQLSDPSLIRPESLPRQVYCGPAARAFFFPWKLASTWMAGDLIRRSAYEATGGLAACDLEVTGDAWLTDQLLARGCFAYVPAPTALYRTRAPGHLEVDPDRRIADFIDMLHIDQNYSGGVMGRSFIDRLKQNVILVRRLGADRRSSRAIKETAFAVFARYGRRDLMLCVSLSLRLPALVRIVSRALGATVLAGDNVQGS